MTHVTELHSAVYTAAARPEVRAAVVDIYGELQRQIDHRRPRCISSGRCCRFDEFGHRLYVTTAELATFVYEFELGNTASFPREDGGGCRFQTNQLCGVHAIRPFGCRVFFCDASSEAWQQEQYERLHARMKRLHEELQVPYFYVEWRTALREIL